MKKYFFILIIISSSTFLTAQKQSTQKPCSSPEASQFDFWVGDWELTWNDTSKGINKISKILDGCSVEENFYNPASNYKGRSVSVYNPSLKLWQQTWVDNTGGYIALTGKFENGEMTLTDQPQKLPDGRESVSRMVFYNITADKFDWRWESSTDKGTAWKIDWRIHYTRKK